jgi:hypothetical protein
MVARRMIVMIAFMAFGCDVDASEADAFRKGGGIWISNGLEDPDASGVDPTAALSTNHGLDPNGALLADAAGLELAGYLVECALPEGEILTKLRAADGQVLVLHGALGLAPEWKDGACDEDCQQWVSACMLARTNSTGESVGLWLVADHPAIGLGHEGAYPLHEATFYGNLFEDPPALYLCRGIEADEDSDLGEYLRSRTCGGLEPEACGFTQWGGCSDAGRCISVEGFATECGDGSPLIGERYHSISTFVAADAGQ